MAKHNIKELEEALVAMLMQKPLLYLAEPITSYERELERMFDEGTILDGPRIWTFYSGSEFPRTDLDNAYSYVEAASFIIICYDHNYSGVESAAAGEDTVSGHPGTRQMVYDVGERIYGNKPFIDCVPFIPVAVRRIDGLANYVSAYSIEVRTELDYFGPATVV